MRYENYHKHTHYSNIRTLDSVCKPEDYIKRAVELGHKNYFTTEHGFQGNIYEAYTLCQQYGLKCIYGVEAYYVDDINDKSSRTNYHIMLIAMKESGRKQINRIMSIANQEGFYYKPRIDLKLLLSLNPDDVIVTTACVAGRMFKKTSEDDENSWENEFFIPVFNHFGKNLYLEVQDHVAKVQADYNKKILAVKEKYGVQLIHANDSHYILPSDAKYRDLFLRAKGMYYEDESGFVLDYPDYDTIVKRYEAQGVLNKDQIKEALENTLVFDESEGIQLDKEFKIPTINHDILKQELPYIGNTQDDDEILRKIIKHSWDEEKKKIDQSRIKEYLEAIYYETDIVKRCGMARYFIIDHIIVKRAVEKYNAILTRSGRGSAVSFYINHLLGLTEIDRLRSPITLYPTRFMSAERILQSRSLPDIDLNFANVEPVIQASKDILGEEGIYYMVAYKPLQESSAFRLWCKANGYNIDEYDEIAKNIELYEDNPKWEEVIDDSKVFRGVIESIAPSPCSFLLLDKPIPDEVGLIRVGNSNSYTMCCALDGYNCDVYKYLKNDCLTVKVYSIISEVYKLIGKPIDDIYTLENMCDDKVWDVYANGLTTTINQSDSDLAKQLLKRYKPRSLAEMSAWVAAIRPGFASLLNTFLDREEYTTGVPELDEILSDSFHFMMYQESIMKYLVWLGMEEKKTYDIIKKISKKKFKEEELADLQKTLESGWIKNIGTNEGFAETWKVVNDAAHYSFNACVSGDTKIRRFGLKKSVFSPTVEEMYNIRNNKEYAEKTNHLDLHRKSKLYGYGNAYSMFDDCRIHKNKIVDIRFSGVRDIYRVQTESGAYLDCTMNHKFPTPDGKFELSKLSVGDSLYVSCDKIKSHNGIPTSIEKIVSIEYIRTDKTYDIEMEDPAHTFISESGLVTSNSHSLSVATDSLYGAYLKSHYPLEYFTVVLTLYADDMERTANLIGELPYFGIKLESIKFGKSGANYSMDKSSNTIYKGIASVKYCNSEIADELLELADTKYENFVQLLADIHAKTSLNSKQLHILTGLNFFDMFGNNKYLLDIIDVYDEFADCKIIAKKKIPEYESKFNITEYSLQKFSGKETKSQYREIDNVGLISYICQNIENVPMSMIESIKFEMEYLQYTTYINPDIADCYYVVVDYKTFSDPTKPVVVIRHVCDGNEIKTRIKQSKIYKQNPFGLFAVLKIDELSYEFKKKNVDGKWISTDETEPILNEYEVMKNV